MQLVNTISTIWEKDKKVALLTQKLPPMAVDKYVRMLLVDEICLTNDIEGVYSTRREIYAALDRKKQTKAKNRLNGLVGKYLKLLNDETICLSTCQDVRALYDELVLDEVCQDNQKNAPDGMIFRRESVSVYSATDKILHTGLYPECQIIDALAKALDFLKEGQVNDLIGVAVFHYLFGYIHPFYDGNGRMMRFISSYQLSKCLSPLAGLKLSYTIKERINQYYRAFEETSDPKNKGELTGFILQFLSTVCQSLDEIYIQLHQLSLQFDYYDSLLSGCHWLQKYRSLILALVQNTLFATRGIGVSELALETKLGEKTVRSHLAALGLKNLIVKQKAGRGYLYDINLDALAQHQQQPQEKP